MTESRWIQVVVCEKPYRPSARNFPSMSSPELGRTSVLIFRGFARRRSLIRPGEAAVSFAGPSDQSRLTTKEAQLEMQGTSTLHAIGQWWPSPATASIRLPSVSSAIKYHRKKVNGRDAFISSRLHVLHPMVMLAPKSSYCQFHTLSSYHP